MNFGTKGFLLQWCTGENRKIVLKYSRFCSTTESIYLNPLCTQLFFSQSFLSVFTLILEFSRRNFNPFDDREVTSKTVMSGNRKTRIFYIQKRVRKCFARWRRRRSCFVVVVVTISMTLLRFSVKAAEINIFFPYFFKEFNCLP